METIFLNTENSKTNEPHRFVLNLPQRLDLRNLNKHPALQNLSIYYTWKNIRKHHKNNKFEIRAPTWIDEFKLPDGSYSVPDIQHYFKYIIKKHEKLNTILPVYVYINRINNRLVFEVKVGNKLELQTPEAMKLIGSTKKLIGKQKTEKTYQILKEVRKF